MAYRRVKNLTQRHLTQLSAGKVAIRWNDCTLWADGERFVMASPKTGLHTLLIAATPVLVMADFVRAFIEHHPDMVRVVLGDRDATG